MTREGTGRPSREAALARYCADRLSLWCLCGRASCVRARSCCGDVAMCSGLALAWLAALQEQEDLAPSFAAMEARIESPQEMRLYRQWRDLLARAQAHAKTPPAETAMLRDKLRRQIEVLVRQQDLDRSS